MRGVARRGIIGDEREFGRGRDRCCGRAGSNDSFVDERLTLGVHVVGNGVRVVRNVDWWPVRCTGWEGVWTPEDAFGYLLRVRINSRPACKYLNSSQLTLREGGYDIRKRTLLSRISMSCIFVLVYF